MKRTILLLVSAVLLPTSFLPVRGGAPDEATLAWRNKSTERYKGNPTDEHKATIESALPAFTATPKAPRKVLVFHRCEGFIHTSIPFANHAIQAWAGKEFSVDLADEYSVFTDENLAQYDGLIFNNTTHLKPNEPQQAAILNFIKGGKGIVGIHAAADNFGGWEEGIALIGGIFDGHPWNAGGNWAFKVEDVDHLINAAFNKKGFWMKDEIYWYKPENFQGREKLRVLLSLDMSHPQNAKPLEDERWAKHLDGKKPSQVDVPVSWIRTLGKGRLFFTNLGHSDMTFTDRKVLQHIADGIQYALGDLEADATPSSEVEVKVAPAPVLSE